MVRMVEKVGAQDREGEVMEGWSLMFRRDVHRAAVARKQGSGARQLQTCEIGRVW